MHFTELSYKLRRHKDNAQVQLLLIVVLDVEQSLESRPNNKLILLSEWDCKEKSRYKKAFDLSNNTLELLYLVLDI